MYSNIFSCSSFAERKLPRVSTRRLNPLNQTGSNVTRNRLQSGSVTNNVSAYSAFCLGQIVSDDSRSPKMPDVLFAISTRRFCPSRPNRLRCRTTSQPKSPMSPTSVYSSCHRQTPNRHQGGSQATARIIAFCSGVIVGFLPRPALSASHARMSFSFMAGRSVDSSYFQSS